ncbi:hypothetical protein U3516DRAFT_621467 [Neocallimastix sp. 'constans']
MSEETLKSLKKIQTQSQSRTSIESKATKKKISFFQKISDAMAIVKLILTLPQFLNTEYYRISFYSQWVDGLVAVSQFGFMTVQIFSIRCYSFCQFFAVLLLGFEMLVYSLYASFHAYIIKVYSRNIYIDCMNNIIETGAIRPFESDYNYHCDTLLKDCITYFEETLNCPIDLMEVKMKNILINRKMFLSQVIMILAMIVIFHIKIANFLKSNNSNMILFKKLKNQDSMKWYHDVLLDKEKEINIMKKDINISLNQINNYIDYDENNDKLIKSNSNGKEVTIDDRDDSGNDCDTNMNEKIKLNNQESFTKIIDDYNKEKKSKSKSIIDININ